MVEPTDTVAAAQSRLSELAVKFKTRTLADIAAMRSQAQQVEAGQIGALAEIRHLAHRMHGTGATLGFDAVSEQAAALETLLDDLPTGVAPGPETMTRITAAIEALAKTAGS